MRVSPFSFSVDLYYISESIFFQDALNPIGSLDINQEDHKKDADIINNITLIIIFVITVINAFISGFGIRHTDTTVMEGMTKRKPL